MINIDESIIKAELIKKLSVLHSKRWQVFPTSYKKNDKTPKLN